MTTPFLGDDRPWLSLIPTLIITTNATVLTLVAVGTFVVFVTKGFHFKPKKTLTTEYIKQRQMTFRLGKDPNSVPLPKFSSMKDMQQEDKKLIYNRLHDPSQFVFEGFGFKRPLTIILYIYRVALALWMTLQMTLDTTYFRPKPFLRYFSFLTNCSAFIFGAYYVMQTVFGLFYITSCYKYYNDSKKTGSVKKHIEDMNPWFRRAFHFTSTIIWLLAEWNHVAATLVAMGYWLIVLPEYATNKSVTSDPDTLSYFTFGYHGLNVVFNVIEFFMSNLVFRVWHVFLLMLYPTTYLIWEQGIMETGLVEVWPYDVVDYYRNPWFSIIIYVFGLLLVFWIAFFGYWIVSKIRLVLLEKRLNRRKSVWRKKQSMRLDHSDENPISKDTTLPHGTGPLDIESANSPPVSPVIFRPVATRPITLELGSSTSTPEYSSAQSASTPVKNGPPIMYSSPVASRPEDMIGLHNKSLTAQEEEFEEPLAPRGNKKTSDVVTKLIKLKHHSTNHSISSVVSSPGSTIGDPSLVTLTVTEPSPRPNN